MNHGRIEQISSLETICNRPGGLLLSAAKPATYIGPQHTPIAEMIEEGTDVPIIFLPEHRIPL